VYRNGQFNLSSPVLVVQLTTTNSDDTSLPEDGNLELDFDISEVCARDSV